MGRPRKRSVAVNTSDHAEMALVTAETVQSKQVVIRPDTFGRS